MRTFLIQRTKVPDVELWGRGQLRFMFLRDLQAVFYRLNVHSAAVGGLLCPGISLFSLVSGGGHPGGGEAVTPMV